LGEFLLAAAQARLFVKFELKLDFVCRGDFGGLEFLGLAGESEGVLAGFEGGDDGDAIAIGGPLGWPEIIQRALGAVEGERGAGEDVSGGL